MSETRKETLRRLFTANNLVAEDVYKHQHTATSTDGKKTIQTFGSALKGQGFKDGNCNTWYVMEMSEKRAMSRAVLKLAGFYELGIFGEDESEDFKKS